MQTKHKKVKQTSKTLCFISGYMEMEISFFQIRFLQTIDKKTYIYAKNGHQYTTYLPLSELRRQLPEGFFIQISRSIIVALSAISRIERDAVILFAGEKLSMSRRRHQEAILFYRKYQELYTIQIEGRQGGMSKEELQRCFGYYELIPIAVAVIEIQQMRDKKDDFIFRYVNQEMVKLEERKNKEELIDRSFREIYEDADEKILELYSGVALGGETRANLVFNREIGKHLIVYAYQPFYGYCVCFLAEMTMLQGLHESGNAVMQRLLMYEIMYEEARKSFGKRDYEKLAAILNRAAQMGHSLLLC